MPPALKPNFSQYTESILSAVLFRKAVMPLIISLAKPVRRAVLDFYRKGRLSEIPGEKCVLSKSFLF
ncbi:MAG: hypothetical protein MR987_07670 [Oscillospiraceae bacterium]|nr:hypothetical protein [Oscillospiraceae bacterium]